MTSRDFVCGRTLSGKSHCIRQWILPDRPRVIIVDPVGDYPTDQPRAFDVRTALEQIRHHVYHGRREWRVVLSVGRDEISDLVESLTPSRDVYGSWCRSVGGVTIVLEEVDLLTPRGQHGEKIASLFRRGRHAEVSAIAATQRPGNVSKEVIAQADRIICYRLTDPDDVAYIRASTSPEAMRVCEIAWRRPHQAMIWEDGTASILTPGYKMAVQTSHRSGQLTLEA